MRYVALIRASALMWLLAAFAAAPAQGFSVRRIQLPGYSAPTQIASADGAVWVTEPGLGAFARIAPDGTVTQFYFPDSAQHDPTGIVTGPDGNLWFTDGYSLGRLTPAGAIQEFMFNGVEPSESSPPGNEGADVVVGGDGQLWFSAQPSLGGQGALLAHVTTAGALGGTVTIPGDPSIVALAAGPDGNVWATQDNPAGVDRVTPSGVVTQILTPFVSGDDLAGLASGPGGTVWAIDNGPLGSGVAPPTRIATVNASDGAVSWLSLPAGVNDLNSIVQAGGDMWATSVGSDVYRIDPTDRVAPFTLGPGDELARIAVGPDGGLWIAEPAVDMVATFSPLVPCSVPRLVGLTLAQVKQLLAPTFCDLGAVHVSGGTLEVHRQLPAAGSQVASGTQVELTFGAPSTLKIHASATVGGGTHVSFTLEGNALGRGYALVAAVDSARCSPDAAAEMQSHSVISGVELLHVGGSYRRKAILTTRGRRERICAYLALGQTTTARAVALLKP